MRNGQNSGGISGILWLALVATIGLAPGAFAAGNWPQVGEQVQNFAFTSLDGKQRQLSDYDGHYVLLEFWATWCPPCVKEIPVLKKALDLYQKRGLEILGLDGDRTLETVQEFVAKNQIPWLQATPESTKTIIDSELRIAWYPTLILLDPQRKILLVSGNGKTPLSPDELLEKLDQLLPAGIPNGRSQNIVTEFSVAPLDGKLAAIDRALLSPVLLTQDKPTINQKAD
jgi:peroxiredoxin